MDAEMKKFLVQYKILWGLSLHPCYFTPKRMKKKLIYQFLYCFLGRGVGDRPHPALRATFPYEGKAALWHPKSGFPHKLLY